ncbi:PIF1-like helicase-domain-containing protein [Cytidiella melzeri]|nr:PIF1-like helicase-domain-containing protein [Cytidiella melzeri]
MSKAGRRKWYAVRTGWDGPRIYDSWEETKKSVLRFRGAQFKSFLSRAQAEEWLEEFRKHSLPPELVGQSDTPAVLDIRTTSLDGEAMPLDDKDAEMSDASNAEPNSSDSSTLTPGDASPAVEPADPPSKSEVKLSPEQQHVLNLVKSDTSVFFTGSAGTGKSILLRAIIQWCKDEGLNHAVTASTGIAAVNIGGCTLHSWAGIALGKETAEKLVGKILGQDKRYRLQAVNGEDSDGDEGSKPRVVKRWRQCKILIIDESMFICPASLVLHIAHIAGSFHG